MSDDEPVTIDHIIAALKAAGIPPSVEVAEMLLCIAGSFYAMALLPKASFLDSAAASFDASVKFAQTELNAEQRALYAVVARFREAPIPGCEEARAAGCCCPSEHEITEKLGPAPTLGGKHPTMHIAMDPMCKVHGEFCMQLAGMAGIAGNA